MEGFKKELQIEEKIKEAIPKSNLTKTEIDALQQLSQRNDIIIKKADKGGVVVITDVDYYIRESNQQLNKTNFYKKIPNDATESKRNKLNNTINEFKLQRILDTTAKNLQTLEARTPNFYMQPKLYKEGNTDRPVIRSVNCHTARILQYVDHSLQPHVQELGSYVKDSTDFTKKKYPQLTKYHKKAFSDMNVRSLSTNISNNEGIKAVETTLKRKNLPTKAIISFLKLILTLSNFVFNSANFLQIKGCTMGTKCALIYASISSLMKLTLLR